MVTPGCSADIARSLPCNKKAGLNVDDEIDFVVFSGMVAGSLSDRTTGIRSRGNDYRMDRASVVLE